MMPNKTNRADRNRKAISGTQKHFASMTSIVLNGVSWTPVNIEQALQASIDATDAANAAEAGFHKAVIAAKAANVTGDSVFAGLKTFVTNQFKTAPDTLADFGITLPSRQVPSATTAAGAVEKRKATRAARHTMGKRQKASVKGTTTVDAPATATSAVATATPAAATQPAAPSVPVTPAPTK